MVSNTAQEQKVVISGLLFCFTTPGCLCSTGFLITNQFFDLEIFFERNHSTGRKERQRLLSY